ncbi:MAG: FtsX-like permease family protein [Sphaerobacteraceae bacterium]|nr:MAG: FtsX-like permease family protein [Sphaerobacteraceae bacterium]
MENIFGIPMTSIMNVLLVIFGLCLLVGAWILLRNRVIFRMGVRNIPRRPAQTVLIIVGLMLSTLIVAAALTTGDTLNHSIRADVYNYLGHTDQIIVHSSEEAVEATDMEQAVPEGGGTVPTSLLEELRAETADVGAIDGFMGVVAEQVPAVVGDGTFAEPVTAMTGLEAEAIEAFGGLRDLEGNTIDLDSLSDGEVVLSETLSESLNLEAGDAFTVFVQNAPHEMTVFAVGEDSYLTGVQTPGMPGGFAIPLSYAQELTGLDSDELNMIAVTNSGDEVSGADRTDEAMAAIEPLLAGTQFNINAVKQSLLEEAELAGNAFSSIFVVLGMFSIAAGILLIFLIFVLLAAERKPEMGMARAVGLKRRQLTQMYIAEGLTYDLAAAAVGAALGVGVAWVIADVIARLIGDFIQIEPSVTWQSLVIAYTLGVVITFITIVISSWRVSRLNIVSAIRDTQEEPKERESRKFLIFGIIGLVLGALMLWGGAESGSMALYTMGISLIPLCLAVIFRRFGFSSRLVYSLAAGLVLLYWVLPWEWVAYIEPEGMSGDFEMFFISGIFMVTSATVLIVWNATVLTSVVSFLGQTFSRWLPAVKTAVAYPLASRGRTGMTIAMFSLIIFSLVAMATINSNFEQLFSGEDASAGWDIQLEQGAVNPIDDLEAALVEGGVDTGQIDAAARMSTVGFGAARLRTSPDEEWGSYTVRGVDETFISESRMPLQIYAEGYESEADVWQAVAEDPTLAVIDAFAVPIEGGIQIGGPGFQLEGVDLGADYLDPITVEASSLLNGTSGEVTIIGIVDQSVSMIWGLYMSEQGFDELFAQPTGYTYLVRAESGVDHTEFAEEMQAALIQYGVQADSMQDLLDEQLAINRGFIYLVQGFMSLGLVVGIAALGVVSFRSVVERRQQIGMLRAIGYSRAMVSASFIIESAMITLLGVLSGGALALWLAYQLITSEEFADFGQIEFTIPWGLILFFGVLAIVASLIMAWIPARQASRVSIADALRYE